MAILKCKMCGGDLNITADEKIIECEYCGSTQTIPDGSDEKKTNLFNRANRLRMDNEFDKAAGVYESIVAEFPEDAEGYWGLVLCFYGIEYVDDAKTGKKIPTCHRTLTSSVMDDDNFIQACENADVVARGVYREEAKAIDRLQQQIIAVVESEEPYDVFICYKETDDITKQRTEDSLIAQDIYTELIKEGYKVFFSRVTLRDKAGTEYEPYIYAALKSAKIMLAIGTKFDYYDAVWVKNEWSRYISMMADDSSKHLIPCFKNLDAYDIPKEFKNLQALDMGEVIFFKNLTDNVDRFISKQAKGQVVAGITSSSTGALTKRGYIYLEDKEFIKAEEYFDKALDENPEDSQAYLGKVLVSLRITSIDEIDNYLVKIYTHKDFERAIRFAGQDEKSKLELIKEQAEKKYLIWRMINALKKYEKKLKFKAIANQKRLEEELRIRNLSYEKIYQQGIKLIEENNVISLNRAISLFNNIVDYNDSKTKLELCFKKLDEIEEKRIISIFEFNQSDEPLSAKEIREGAKPKISKSQSRLEKMAQNNIVEIIIDGNVTKYCLRGYENRKRIKEIDSEIRKLEFAKQEKIQEEIEAEEIQNRIKKLSERKNELSIFAIKEKKKIQIELDELLVAFLELQNEIKLKRSEIDIEYYKQIDILTEEKEIIKNFKN